jgi:hypothetical protein
VPRRPINQLRRSDSRLGTPYAPNRHTFHSVEYGYSYPFLGNPSAYGGSGIGAIPYSDSRSGYQSHLGTYGGHGVQVTPYGRRGSNIHRGGSTSTTYRGGGRGSR